MKKFFLILLFSVFILSGCTEAKKVETVVTRTGTLTMKVGDEYILKTESEMVNIISNKVNLDNYIKQKISVTGQFSGSTLYVDEIK